jgi:hypothetical protein
MGIAGLFGGPHPCYKRPLTRLAATIIIATGEPVNGQAAILGVEELRASLPRTKCATR